MNVTCPKALKPGPDARSRKPLRYHGGLRALACGAAVLVSVGCSGLPTTTEYGRDTSPLFTDPGTVPGAQVAERRAPSAEGAPVPVDGLSPPVLYQILAAELAAQRGHLDWAAERFLDAAEAVGDPRLAQRAARIALYHRNFAHARRAAELWVALDPADVDARQSLAALMIREGETEQALPHLEAVLSGDASRRGFEMVVQLLNSDPDRQRAFRAFSALTASRPDDAEAWFAQARLALALDQPAEALEALERAIELEPDRTQALMLRAAALRQLGETQQALLVYRAAVESDPEDSGIRLNYARMLVEEDRLEEARAQFQILLEQLPGNDDILYALGVLARQAGDRSSAEGYFRGLIGSERHTQDAVLSLAGLAEERNEWDEAVRWYGSVPEESELFIDAQLRIAELTARRDGVAAGLNYLRSVPAQAHEQIQVILTEQQILQHGGQSEEAFEVLTRALDAWPRDAQLLYARAMVAFNLDRIDLLERDLRVILDDDPDSAQALNALGYTLADRNERLDEAYAMILRAFELRPDDAAIIDSMGWVLYRLGRLDEALQYLRRAAELMDDGEIAAHLGEVLWVSGQRDEARAVWEAALEHSPDHPVLNRVMDAFLR